MIEITKNIDKITESHVFCTQQKSNGLEKTCLFLIDQLDYMGERK